MLLFSILLFPVMESSTIVVSEHGSRPQTPDDKPDEEMPRCFIPLKALSLEVNDEHRSDLVDQTILDKRGILIQFLNSNCTGSPHVFGGMRLSLLDIRKFPAYLSRNKRSIKQHAVHALMQHFKEMQCAVGATEELNTDDFGMSFTVATVTGHGALLNPGKRQEGPLFFCHFPALIDPVVLVQADWGTHTEGEAVHMVNCYISLPPPQLRRTLVIKRFMQDQAASAINARAATTLTGSTVTTPQGATASGYATKKSKMSAPTTPYVRTPSAPRPDDSVTRELADLRNQVRTLRAQALPNPPLPNLVNRPPIWPARMGNPCPDLPDE